MNREARGAPAGEEIAGVVHRCLVTAQRETRIITLKVRHNSY